MIQILLLALASQTPAAPLTDSVITPAPSPVLADSGPATAPSVSPPPGSAPAEVAPATVAVPPADPAPAATAPPAVPAAPAAARRTTLERNGPWQVGLVAGGASGWGVSFRRWFGDADALQLNLAPYLSNRNYPGTDDPANESNMIDSGFILEASLSAGLSWLHQVVQVPLFEDRGELKVLTYLAGGTYLSVDQQQMDRWIADETKGRRKIYDDYYRTRKEFRLGGGGGCELSRWRMSTTLMLGLGGWYEATSEDYGVSADGQWGVHFRF